jgi:hypothetical protein
MPLHNNRGAAAMAWLETYRWSRPLQAKQIGCGGSQQPHS